MFIILFLVIVGSVLAVMERDEVLKQSEVVFRAYGKELTAEFLQRVNIEELDRVAESLDREIRRDKYWRVDEFGEVAEKQMETEIAMMDKVFAGRGLLRVLTRMEQRLESDIRLCGERIGSEYDYQRRKVLKLEHLPRAIDSSMSFLIKECMHGMKEHVEMEFDPKEPENILKSFADDIVARRGGPGQYGKPSDAIKLQERSDYVLGEYFEGLEMLYVGLGVVAISTLVTFVVLYCLFGGAGKATTATTKKSNKDKQV